MSILRALLSSVYLYACIDKLGPASLNGFRLYLNVINFYFGSLAPPEWLQIATMISTWFVVAMEFVLAVAPWVKSLREKIFPFAVLFHLILFYIIQVGPFSAEIILLWILVVFPETEDRSSSKINNFC
jgi:hypothetical protein